MASLSMGIPMTGRRFNAPLGIAAPMQGMAGSTAPAAPGWNIFGGVRNPASYAAGGATQSNAFDGFNFGGGGGGGFGNNNGGGASDPFADLKNRLKQGSFLDFGKMGKSYAAQLDPFFQSMIRLANATGPAKERALAEITALLSGDRSDALLGQMRNQSNENAAITGSAQARSLASQGFGEGVTGAAVSNAYDQAGVAQNDYAAKLADPMYQAQMKQALLEALQSGNPNFEPLLQLYQLTQKMGGGGGGGSSGIFGAIGSLLSNPGIFKSDVRLKSNVSRVGQHPLGIGIYEYDIDGRRERGVMAHEVLFVKPSAVMRDESGYWKVDYRQL